MEKIIPAILGFLAGILGGFISPWVNWGIEKKRQKLFYRRELISKWRKMVKEATRIIEENTKIDEKGKTISFTPAEILERHEDFYSLKPHLSRNTISEIYRTRTFIVGSTIHTPLALIIDEISIIERKWGLI